MDIVHHQMKLPYEEWVKFDQILGQTMSDLF